MRSMFPQTTAFSFPASVTLRTQVALGSFTLARMFLTPKSPYAASMAFALSPTLVLRSAPEKRFARSDGSCSLKSLRLTPGSGAGLPVNASHNFVGTCRKVYTCTLSLSPEFCFGNRLDTGRLSRAFTRNMCAPTCPNDAQFNLISP